MGFYIATVYRKASSVRWIDEIHITIQVDVKLDGLGLAISGCRVTRLLALQAALRLRIICNLLATAYAIFALVISTLHILYHLGTQSTLHHRLIFLVVTLTAVFGMSSEVLNGAQSSLQGS